MNKQLENIFMTTPQNLVAINMIEELDFSNIKIKLVRQNKISEKQINHTENDYRRFLKLILLFPREKIVPTNEIDIFWHEHILDSKRYVPETTKIFGQYLHHDPNFGGENGDKLEWEKAFANTKNLYFKLFKDIIVDVKSDCAGDSGSEGSCWPSSNDN
jgi:hypothetical protein